MVRNHLTRIDTLLLVAFFLALAVQVGVVAWQKPPKLQGSPESSWGQEQSSVRERLRKAALFDRETLERKVRENRQLAWRIQAAALGGFGLLLASGFGIVRASVRFLRKQPLLPRLSVPGPPAWGGRQILRLVLVVLLVIQSAALIQWGFFFLWAPDASDRHGTALIHTLLIDAVVILGAGWFLTHRRSPSPQGGVGVWAHIRFALLSYATFVPFLVVVALLVAALLRLLAYDPAPQAVFTIYLAESRTPVLTALIFLVTFVGPVAEELFFRGLLYGWLRYRVGVLKGLGVSALLFAGLHADAVAFFPILGLGLLFGWIYERSGSLLAPTAAHIFHNAAMLYLASLVKDLTAL